MTDIVGGANASVEGYDKFIKEGNFTDLELAAAYYIYRNIPEFREAFGKEYALRNNKPFDAESERRILDTVRDDHVASAILFEKNIEKAQAMHDRYIRLGLE